MSQVETFTRVNECKRSGHSNETPVDIKNIDCSKLKNKIIILRIKQISNL